MSVKQAVIGASLNIRRLISRFGSKVKRYAETPPPLYDDPMEALYNMWDGNRASFMCELERCVTYNGLEFRKGGWHPFEATLREYECNGASTYEGSTLQRFYESWTPANARSALICELYSSYELTKHPSYAFVFPWEPTTIQERIRHVKRYMREEGKKFSSSITVENGYNHHGPVSEEKGQIEYDRCVNVFNSIKSNGYKRERGDVRVTILRRGDEVRFLIKDGFHRTAAVSALGYSSVPAVPRHGALIDIAHVDDWPQVKKGVWLRDDAIRYFDHLFEFDSRQWAGELDLVTNT